MSAPVKAPRVGPNAVIQMALAVRHRHGPAAERGLLATAGLARYIGHLPETMIDEQEAADMFRALFDTYPAEEAAALADTAGTETAAYILAHRIPKPVQWLLAVLPAGLAARILLSAIAKHAWTFAGSGDVTATFGHPSRIVIRANPLTMPGCLWHQAVFTRLFRALVDRDAVVRQTTCCRTGSSACTFEIAAGAKTRALAPIPRQPTGALPG